MCKILGIIWNREDDTLAVPGPSIDQLKGAFTKHEVLQVVASVFDPFEYYSPTVLTAKLFIQELWKEKWKWDTNLNSQKLQKWMLIVGQKLQKWMLIVEQLRSIPHHTIARYLGLLNDDQCCVKSTLHFFVMLLQRHMQL